MNKHAVETQVDGQSSYFNYLLVLLMMLQVFLGATTFNQLQMITEIALWLMLGYGIYRVGFNQWDLIILGIFVGVTGVSLAINSLHTVLLNFKIFGLFIFTIIYFRKVDFFPVQLLYFYLFLNVLYALVVRHLNIWPLESAWFFDKQETYLYSRPIGFLGSPHSTSTFICLFVLYLAMVRKYVLLQISLFYILYIYASWTAVIAAIIGLIYYWIVRLIRIRLNPFLFLSIGLVILYLSLQIILEFVSNIEGSRVFTLEIMTAMIFDPEFYRGIFSLFPRSHDLFILEQEKSFAAVGNELGIIKILVEGGVILAIPSLYLIFKRTNHFTIFFLITLFHYTFFINMPLILFIAMAFTRQINNFNSELEQRLISSVQQEPILD